MHTRLSEFIRAELEPILKAWEEFARTILHTQNMGKSGLRDHAKDMLLEIADDLDSHQSESEQAEKSKGRGPDEGEDSWAEVHGEDRHSSGFTVIETVSEFRALRASVISLWSKADPAVSRNQLEDLTRFHEAIDQAVSESLEQYAIVKEMETRLFGAILAASPDPIYVLDPGGRFIYVNKATADLFALQSREIIGKSCFELGFPFASDFQRDLEKMIDDQATYRGKFTHTFASGQGEKFEYLLAPVVDDHGDTEAAVCISRDVTEQALAERKVWHNAHHDILTDLPNRRLFLDRLDQEIKHAKRMNAPVSVLFMDLNGFKDVNDTYGHDAGDRLLRDVSERITDCVREEDTVARMGGDEFTVILTGAKQREDVEFVAQSIIDGLALPFIISHSSVQISVSVGISYFPTDAATPVALIQAADRAMYKAKKSGYNQICSLDRPPAVERHRA